MSYFSKTVSVSSTVYSGLATPDVQIPFAPNTVRLVLNAANPVEYSFAGPPSPNEPNNAAGVLYPSPHPAALQQIGTSGGSKEVWLRNLVSGSTASVTVMADDCGY